MFADAAQYAGFKAKVYRPAWDMIDHWNECALFLVNFQRERLARVDKCEC